VAVVTTPEDYTRILHAVRSGDGILEKALLFELARKAFLYTARYDAQISEHLSRIEHFDAPPDLDGFPPRLFMNFEKIQDLRYGENPHQKAAFYKWGNQPAHGLSAAQQLQGKELSYNNIVDLDAAWNLILEFDEPACCIIKHTNPCGTAIGASIQEAYLKAYQADSVSAFGSIIALNRKVDRETAGELAKLFVEAI